jgi:hypothetical protein
MSSAKIARFFGQEAVDYYCNDYEYSLSNAYEFTTENIMLFKYGL